MGGQIPPNRGRKPRQNFNITDPQILQYTNTFLSNNMENTMESEIKNESHFDNVFNSNYSTNMMVFNFIFRD